MGQQAVVTVGDVKAFPGEQRHNGCSKGIMHAGEEAEVSVFVVKPGGGVPVHLHSRSHDLFIGISGEVEILYEGQQGSGKVALGARAFCSMPPGVRHEVRNANATQEAVFIMIHAPQAGYDFVRVPFKVHHSAFAPA